MLLMTSPAESSNEAASREAGAQVIECRRKSKVTPTEADAQTENRLCYHRQTRCGRKHSKLCFSTVYIVYVNISFCAFAFWARDCCILCPTLTAPSQFLEVNTLLSWTKHSVTRHVTFPTKPEIGESRCRRWWRGLKESEY